MPPVAELSAPVSKVKPAVPNAGREALLLNGGALLAFGIAAILSVYEQSTDAIAMMSTVGGVSLVLGIWSAFVAARAILAGLGNWRTKLAFALCVIEAVAGSILLTVKGPLLPYMLWSSIPFFVPALAILSLPAAPLAWWWARRSERRDGEKGIVWDSRKRWRFGAWRFGGIVAALVVVALPGPFFLYCVMALAQPKPWNGNKLPWQAWAIQYIPTPIRDAFARPFLTQRVKAPWAGRRSPLIWPSSVIEFGQLSSDLLEEILENHEHYLWREAWASLRDRFPDRAKAFGESVVQNRGLATLHVQASIASFIVKQEDDAAIRALLAAPGIDASFKTWTIAALGSRIDAFVPEFVPFFEHVFKGSNPPIGWPQLIEAIGRLSDERVRFRLIVAMLASPDPQIRLWALSMLTNSEVLSVHMRWKMSLACLEHASLSIRKSTCLTLFRGGCKDAAIVRKLVAMLNDADAELRRCAEFALAQCLGLGISQATYIDDDVERPVAAYPLTPAQTAGAAAASVAAWIWLAENAAESAKIGR